MIQKFQNPNSPLRVQNPREHESQRYNDWLKMSWTDKIKRKLRIAKSQLERGPAIQNIGRAIYSLFGGYTPENPYLSYGVAPSPAKPTNQKEVISTASKVKGLSETLLSKGWKNTKEKGVFLSPKGERFIRNPQGQLQSEKSYLETLKNTKGKSPIEINKDIQPKINLKNYRGEKLTGKEDGFDEWALKRIPESDHFANLSHGLNNENLLPIMNREFEALPNGSRVDLGEIFSSDSSSNLLQYVRRNNKRIKMVLPKNAEEMIKTNDYGTRGANSANIFNEQLEKLLDLYGYSPNAVPKAVYNPTTNTLTVPKLTFIKLFKKGNKINNEFNI